MFGLFTWFGSMVIALSYLVWVIAFPIMAGWFFLSVRRSLARIADSLDGAAQVASVMRDLSDKGVCIVSQEDARRISTSAFGR